MLGHLVLGRYSASEQVVAVPARSWMSRIIRTILRKRS